MWFASTWIFNLGLPWQLGATFFFKHLYDGDASSNLLSWRWVAGLQTKGKQYLFSPSNLRKFSNNRLNVEKINNKQILIEGGKWILVPSLALNYEMDPYVDDDHRSIKGGLTESSTAYTKVSSKTLGQHNGSIKVGADFILSLIHI